jgi:hypothetical protein
VSTLIADASSHPLCRPAAGQHCPCWTQIFGARHAPQVNGEVEKLEDQIVALRAEMGEAAAGGAAAEAARSAAVAATAGRQAGALAQAELYEARWVCA